MSSSLFKSSRLVYRAFRGTDFDELYDAWNHPEVQVGGSPSTIKPKSQGLIKSFKKLVESWELFVAVADKESKDNIMQVKNGDH
jgi:hypothetical protein